MQSHSERVPELFWYFFVTRWVGVRNTSSFYRRQSSRALPCAANVFFFFFKALVYRRHTNDYAETWWEQEGWLWYRVPMATIQNGMHSPWQQSWRGNIAETASELVLASGCLKWCMHGSSTAFAHDGSWTQTYHFCGRILAIMAKMYISKHAILFCSGA